MNRLRGEIGTRDHTNSDGKRTVTEVRLLNVSKLDWPPRSEKCRLPLGTKRRQHGPENGQVPMQVRTRMKPLVAAIPLESVCQDVEAVASAVTQDDLRRLRADQLSYRYAEPRWNGGKIVITN
jgi:hypothetical protein